MVVSWWIAAFLRCVHSPEKLPRYPQSVIDQSHMPITCDEGVYHIARATIMNNPTEFSNLILCLGSFHLIKVVMGAIGKYIESNGAEIILAEAKAFGKNVVRSVLLSECFERLQWAEFFRIKGLGNK